MSPRPEGLSEQAANSAAGHRPEKKERAAWATPTLTRLDFRGTEGKTDNQVETGTLGTGS